MPRAPKIIRELQEYIDRRYAGTILVVGAYDRPPKGCTPEIKYTCQLNSEWKAWEEEQKKLGRTRAEALESLHVLLLARLAELSKNQPFAIEEEQGFAPVPFATNLLPTASIQQHAPAALNNVQGYQYASQQLTQAHQELQGVFAHPHHNQYDATTTLARATEGQNATYQGGRVPRRRHVSNAAGPYSRGQKTSTGGIKPVVKGPSTSRQADQRAVVQAIRQQGGVLPPNLGVTFAPIPTNDHAFAANLNFQLVRHEQGLVYNARHHLKSAPQVPPPPALHNYRVAEQARDIQAHQGTAHLSFADAFAQDPIAATFGLCAADFPVSSPSPARLVTPVMHDSPESYFTSPLSHDAHRQADSGDISPSSTRVGSSLTTPVTKRTIAHGTFDEDVDFDTVWPAKEPSFDEETIQSHDFFSLFPPATTVETKTVAPVEVKPTAEEIAHDKEWEEYASFWDEA